MLLLIHLVIAIFYGGSWIYLFLLSWIRWMSQWKLVILQPFFIFIWIFSSIRKLRFPSLSYAYAMLLIEWVINIINIRVSFHSILLLCIQTKPLNNIQMHDRVTKSRRNSDIPLFFCRFCQRTVVCIFVSNSSEFRTLR